VNSDSDESDGESSQKKKGKDSAPVTPVGDINGLIDPQSLVGFGSQATEQVSTPMAHEEVSGESSEEEHLVTRRTRVEFATRSMTIDRLEKLIHLRTRRFTGIRRPSGLSPFVKDMDSYMPTTPTSLSSARLSMIIHKGVEGALRQFSSTHLLKVYPNTDIPTDSPGWVAGAQLVPVNFNSSSAMTLAEEAFFQDNGCCGFVQKPSWMLKEPMIPPEENAIKLTVKIISARQLPRIDSEVVDPFVAMFIKGWKEDQDRYTTKVVVNNGWDPRWDESHEFILRAPELDVLLFSVWDKDNNSQNDFIANAAVAVRSMKLGVHALPLYNENRVALLGSRLLIEVSMEPLIVVAESKAISEARGKHRRSKSGRRVKYGDEDVA